MTTVTRSETVLVVDDADGNRFVVGAWLRRAGFQVLEASTGEEALHVAMTQPVDLVILDVNLPDMSGFAVCERLRDQERADRLPVLHLSATAVDATARSEGLRRGADGYLVEPVEREELLASVEALLRSASAERTAVRLGTRLRRLTEATIAVNDCRTLEQLVSLIARHAAALSGRPAVAVARDDERTLAALAGPGSPATTSRGDGSVAEAVLGLAGRGAVEGEALRAVLPAAPPGRYRGFVLERSGAEAAVLLVGEAAAAPGEHGPDAEEIDLVLAQYQNSCAIAVRNLRGFHTQRRIAVTLQRSLLQRSVPAPPGLHVTVRYVAATEQAEVGGDFYEVLPIDDDRTVIAIGDVVGHSLEAAATMAQLRAALRAYALEGHPPASALERLNSLMLRFHAGATATACCALYDAREGTIEVANAGHLPPVLVSSGHASLVPVGGLLLGVEETPVDSTVVRLEPGDLVLLFTDGLVERRGESLDEGLLRLLTSCRSLPADLDRACDAILRDVAPAFPEDDIALIAMSRATRPVTPG